MQKSITSASSWIKFFDQFMARLKFNFDGKQLNESEILDLMSSSNSSTRKKSALSFGRTLKENSFYLGSIINNISKDLDIDKDIRESKNYVFLLKMHVFVHHFLAVSKNPF